MAGAAPIAIVGGGAAGTGLAYHLRDADPPVVLLEANEYLGGGATHDSAGVIGLRGAAPPAVRRDAWSHYGELGARGAIDIERTGALVVRTDDGAIAELERTARELKTFDHSTALLDPDEIASFGVRPPQGARALHLPDEGYVDPSAVLSHWIEAAGSAGVDVRIDTSVLDVLVRDGEVVGVETPSGPIEAGAVVNAAGPWAPELNESAGIDVPLRHTYVPRLVFDADEPVELPVTEFQNGHCFREDGRTRLYAGRSGRPYGEAERRDPDATRRLPESFHLDVQRVMDAWLPAHTDARLVEERLGQRTVTPDGRPLAGETDVTGYYLACGLGERGIAIAPGVGRHLATALLDGEETDALGALDPKRFDEDD